MSRTLDKEKIIAQILQQAEKESLFSADEAQVVRAALEELSLDDLVQEYLPKWYGELWRWKPVGMEEWLYGAEYMNLRGEIYPRLAEDLIELFEGNYREAVIEGSIGWGKSFFSGLAITRMLYEISCYQNPQMAFGLASNSQIVLANIATKEKVAKEVVFEYVAGFVRRSKYFQKHFPPEKHLEREIVFPHRVRVMPAASTQGSVIGQNLYGAVLDEANFLFKGQSERAGSVNEDFDLAKVLWNAIIRRIKSRFGTQHPGIMLNVSSSMYPDDFTKWRWETAQKNDENVFYRRYSQWETKPRYDGFDQDPSQYFRVSVGDAGHRPRIIRAPDETEYDEKLDDVDALKEAGVKVVKVPNDFRVDFERDVDMAIRDVAGFATLSAYPFFRDMTIFTRSYQRAKARGLLHPWSQETTTLLDDSTWFENRLDFDKRGRHHFAHVDLALTGDSAAISIVRLDGIEERAIDTPTINEISGEVQFSTIYVYEPKMTTVLTLRIVPSQSSEIPISRVRKIVLDLVTWGFYVTKVTYDQFQSAESIQALVQLGVESDNLSVDRTLEPYNALKEALFEDRLDIYEYPWITREAQSLEMLVDKQKVDHPPGKSKDVTDSLAGAVFNCVDFVRDNPGIMLKGAFEEDDEEYVGPTPIEYSKDPDEEDLSWVFG